MSLEFEQLLEQNIGRIQRIAQRYASVGETEDLCQEISMALWRSFDSFRGESSRETWLYRVALNTALTRVRKTIKEREQVTEFKARSTVSDTVPEGLGQADILTDFINTLGEIDASVLMMYLDGLSTLEMEQVLGITSNAINVRVNRIKQKFSETYVD